MIVPLKPLAYTVNAGRNNITSTRARVYNEHRRVYAARVHRVVVELHVLRLFACVRYTYWNVRVGRARTCLSDPMFFRSPFTILWQRRSVRQVRTRSIRASTRAILNNNIYARNVRRTDMLKRVRGFTRVSNRFRILSNKQTYMDATTWTDSRSTVSALTALGVKGALGNDSKTFRQLLLQNAKTNYVIQAYIITRKRRIVWLVGSRPSGRRGRFPNVNTDHLPGRKTAFTPISTYHHARRRIYGAVSTLRGPTRVFLLSLRLRESRPVPKTITCIIFVISRGFGITVPLDDRSSLVEYFAMIIL